MSYIKGKFYKKIFCNTSNGYYVGLLKVNECSEDLSMKGKIVNFVGNFHELLEDSTYIMHGNIVMHLKYGEQFKVDEYELLKPEKKEEIVTFLSSDLFPIGPVMAKRIYDLLGNNCIDKILENPSVLTNVPRLTTNKIDKIYNSLKEYQYSGEIIIKLNELGFSFKESLSIYNKYKGDTLEIINKNIYELINSLDINFLTIDNIALKMGVLDNDDNRLKALVIYIIKKFTFETGDIYVYLEDIYRIIVRYVNIDIDELEYLLIKLNKIGKIIIDKDKYYIKEVFDNENFVLEKLIYLNNKNTTKRDVSKYLSVLEKENNVLYDEKQKEAITKSINNNITIITGGPGTGKTTIVKAIVSILINSLKVLESDIALLAPTGRASKRLSESTLLPAITIHRYLKWDKETDVFSINEYNPNPQKYIIVDEVSMIDNNLMASLLKGITDDVRIIFVGDYHQLPSVREGQVLKDLIDSEVFDVIKLNSLYRQNENSYIVTLANEIKNKDLSDFTLKRDDYNFIKVDNNSVIKMIEDIIDKSIIKGYTDLDVQILAPIYKGENGIDNLNKVLQKKFNPKSATKKELEVGEIIYRVGDKILQLVNNIDNNVFNGDIGYITNIISSKDAKSKKNEIHVNYDGNVVIYTPNKFIEITHGYAISVHKAQGSEFDIVIIPVVNSYRYMLYNKLIYTAITRAKKNLILVGDNNSFIYAVNNDYTIDRKTSLKEKLINKYKN